MVMAEDTAAMVANDRRIQPTFGYYRQPNGWITVSPITQMERVKYIEEGWQHLGRYGAFDMSPYVANHPFEALFMFGGVQEMSLDQVIQTGLYLDPPLVPRCKQQLTQYHRGHTQQCWIGATRVEFPQLADADPALIGPFPCAFCPRQMATIQAREQHHTVAHKDDLRNLQTGQSLGTSLAEALKNNVQPGAANNARTDPPRIDLEAMQSQIEEMAQTIADLQTRKPQARKRTTSKAKKAS